MPEAKSKAQAGLFGAIAAGTARKGTGTTRAEARKRLRGVEVSKLPARMQEGGVVMSEPMRVEGPFHPVEHSGGWGLAASGGMLVAVGFETEDEAKVMAGVYNRQGYILTYVHLRPLEEGGVATGRHTVYAVVENMPGYLPELEPVWFDSLDEAESYAREQEADLREAELDDIYIVDIIEETVPGNIDADYLNEHGYGEPKTLQEGAVVEEPGPGIPAVIGEAGPEAVIPLDDPEAVEVMAEAIEEGGGGEPEVEAAAEAVEAAAEAVEAAAEAVEVVAVAGAAGEIAEAEAEAVEEVAEAAAEAVEAEAEAIEGVAEAETEAVEAEAEAVEEVADTAPDATHWWFRMLTRR